jgi:hypothetical protein
VAQFNGETMEFPCDAVMVSVGLTPNSEVARLWVSRLARNSNDFVWTTIVLELGI